MTDDPISNEPQYESAGLSSVPPPAVEPLSITDKFIGILTEPAPTYENVRAAGARTTDWLIPVLVTAAILAVSMFIRFSNPEFVTKMQEQQVKAMMEKVNSGDMTQEKADEMVEAMGSKQARDIMKFFGPISALVGFVIIFFVLTFLYWLAVRFGLKGDASFALVLSAVGLSTYISGLDQLVSLLLSFVSDKPFVNLSPALFFDFDIASTASRLLMMLDPFLIWATYVLGIGFEKVANISRMKGMIGAFGIWILFSLLGLLLGFGM